jgi:hypothetical protein
MKRQGESAHGAGMNPNNSLSRELTKAKQAAMARRKPSKPSKPAKYTPQQVLIKKKP